MVEIFRKWAFLLSIVQESLRAIRSYSVEESVLQFEIQILYLSKPSGPFGTSTTQCMPNKGKNVPRGKLL